MNTPGFYDPQKVGKQYVPDTAGAIAAGQALGLPPAAHDERRVLLLLIDAQVDFIHEDGALAVPGAVADTVRTIEWIFRNVDKLTTIAASLDSHTPQQIFYPTWWVDTNGQHPEPFTPINRQDVETGRWIPLVEPNWSRQYVKQLDSQAKKVLMIWPYHTMIGTVGQSLCPALYEAIAFHAGARKTQPEFLYKGYINKTEHYSILEPEIKVPDHPLGALNQSFLNMLAGYDLIYIAGQAKSHCVLETVTSIMRFFADRADVIQRLRFLEDCTSSVAHPEIDFDAIADETLAKFRMQGMQFARSTDQLG